jgi:hypothetical protein
MNDSNPENRIQTIKELHTRNQTITIDDDGDDISEIPETTKAPSPSLCQTRLIELQKASESIRHIQQQQQDLLHDNNNKYTSIESIEYIPRLVNQIIAETSEGSKKAFIRTLAINELLISVILGFSQCFLKSLTTEELCKKKSDGDFNEVIHESEKRVLDWVSDTILDLLNNSVGRIPILDALLATTGNHNGMSHDTILQGLMLPLVEGSACCEEDDDLLDIFHETDAQQHVCESDLDSPQLFCDHYLNSSVELDGRDEDMEEICSNNLFLGQMESFLRRHDNDDSLQSMIIK